MVLKKLKIIKRFCKIEKFLLKSKLLFNNFWKFKKSKDKLENFEKNSNFNKLKNWKAFWKNWKSSKIQIFLIKKIQVF